MGKGKGGIDLGLLIVLCIRMRFLEKRWCTNVTIISSSSGRATIVIVDGLFSVRQIVRPR